MDQPRRHDHDVQPQRKGAMIVELKAGQLSFDWIIHIHGLPPLISQAASECACNVDARTCY